MTPAERIATELTVKYELRYRTQVNIEACANKALVKMTEEEALDCFDDLIANVLED